MSLDDSEPKEQQAKEAQKEPDDDSNSEEEAAGGEWQQPTSCATLKAASHDNNSQLEATVGLLRHCRELDGFLATWREAYAELRGAVLELQTLTTSQSELTTSRFERRGQLTKANLAGRGRTDVAKDAEVELEFTSLAINNNSKTHLSTALGDVLGEAIGDVLGEADDKLGNIVNGRPSLINGKDRHGGHHSPHGSDDDSSSSFDLEVEEEWSKRISDMEARLREKEQYEDYDDDDDDDARTTVTASSSVSVVVTCGNAAIKPRHCATELPVSASDCTQAGSLCTPRQPINSEQKWPQLLRRRL
mmetsp:Transcript_11663/g.22589  ORF Transcript_11663/g.22589 Transcript_11663/m.22589 type:complete len:304 (-) Transcript_11663:362-1273(-)